MTKLSFDSESKVLNKMCNFAESVKIDGTEIQSLLQSHDDTIMICEIFKACIIEADSLMLLRTIDINSNVSDYYQRKIPLLYKHMIPETNQGFMVEFYDSQFVYIRNIRTGVR